MKKLNKKGGKSADALKSALRSKLAGEAIQSAPTNRSRLEFHKSINSLYNRGKIQGVIQKERDN